MKVIEQYFDARTGESAQREVEMPDVITEQQARERGPTAARLEEQRSELRAQMLTALAEQALGVDVTARKKELCDAFAALRM